MALALVQFAVLDGIGTVPQAVLGSAPTAGNWLICMGWTWSENPTIVAGWELVVESDANVDWNWQIYRKLLGAGESTTQFPWTQTGHAPWLVALYEVSGGGDDLLIINGFSVLEIDQTGANPAVITCTAVTPNVAGCMGLASGLALCSGGTTDAGYPAGWTGDAQYTTNPSGDKAKATFAHLLGLTNGTPYAPTFSWSGGAAASVEAALVILAPPSAPPPPPPTPPQLAVISFAGNVLPIGSRIVSRTIDSQIDDVPMLSRQGSYAPAGLASGQSVQLEVDVGGGDTSPTTELPLFTADDVNDEINRLYASLANGYQELVIGEVPARSLLCQKRKSSVTYEPAFNRAKATLKVELFALDPRWLSTVLHSTTAFSTNPVLGTAIVNAGNMDTFPLLTFSGPSSTGAAITVILFTPTGAYYKLATTAVLAPSDVLVIDCDPNTPNQQRFMLNGVARYDLFGTPTNTMLGADLQPDGFIFPRMMPGTSGITAIGGYASTSTIAWRDAFAL